MALITRLFFIAAATHNLFWMVLLLGWPMQIMVALPPRWLFAPLIGIIGVIGGACAVCAIKPRKQLIAATLFAKACGPLAFVVSAWLGYLAWRQWWLPIVTDVIWLWPLWLIWRKEARV